MNLTPLDITILSGILGFFVWLSKLVVKHDFDKKLAEYRRELQIRDQSAKVAEFFAHLYSTNPDIEKLNRYAWELSLWLPSELVCDISRLVCQEADAKSPKDILIAIRKHILMDSNDSLEAKNLLHFNDPSSRRPVIGDLLKDSTANSIINS